MFKKHFRDFYLTFISFIAGVMFIVQCGGGSSTIAAAISNAFGIDFDNSSSSLSSTNVGDAIKELESRLPLVFDNDGTVIGMFMDRISTGWTVWSFDLNTVLDLDPLTGELITNANGSEWVYFSNADCTGTPYMQFQDYEGVARTRTIKVGSTYYTQNFRGEYLRESTTGLNSLQSYSDGTDCNTASLPFLIKTIDSDELDYTYVEAREVSVSDYSAPLLLGTGS